jgi:DNA-binding MarR family transcriptional regulator
MPRAAKKTVGKGNSVTGNETPNKREFRSHSPHGGKLPGGGKPKASTPLGDRKRVVEEQIAPGLWYYNWRISLEANSLLERALAPLGLRPREFWLLAIAGAGDISQQRMAELCGLDPSSLVAVLDGLEKRGWLRRRRNPSDRRMQWVQRTEAGDHLVAQARPRAQRAEAQQISVLSPAQQRQLIAAMHKLVTISK